LEFELGALFGAWLGASLGVYGSRGGIFPLGVGPYELLGDVGAALGSGEFGSGGKSYRESFDGATFRGSPFVGDGELP
jgi:hypothetical protein